MLGCRLRHLAGAVSALVAVVLILIVAGPARGQVVNVPVSMNLSAQVTPDDGERGSGINHAAASGSRSVVEHHETHDIWVESITGYASIDCIGGTTGAGFFTDTSGTGGTSDEHWSISWSYTASAKGEMTIGTLANAPAGTPLTLDVVSLWGDDFWRAPGNLTIARGTSTLLSFGGSSWEGSAPVIAGETLEIDWSTGGGGSCCGSYGGWGWQDGYNVTVSGVAVPEPGAFVLLTTALLAALGFAWRKRRWGSDRR